MCIIKKRIKFLVLYRKTVSCFNLYLNKGEFYKRLNKTDLVN